MHNRRYGYQSPNPTLERDPSYERENREYREFSDDRGRRERDERFYDDRSFSDQDPNWRRMDWPSGVEQTYPRAYDLDYGRVEMSPSRSREFDRDRWGRNAGWGRDERRENRPSEGFMESVRNFFGIGPKGYKRSDERIREDVCEALAHHPEIDASDIEVDVTGGYVTLKGHVENRQIKRLAERSIEQISGIEDVHNLLRIYRPIDTNHALTTTNTNKNKTTPSART
jgi:hypothetical protein